MFEANKRRKNHSRSFVGSLSIPTFVVLALLLTLVGCTSSGGPVPAPDDSAPSAESDSGNESEAVTEEPAEDSQPSTGSSSDDEPSGSSSESSSSDGSASGGGAAAPGPQPLPETPTQFGSPSLDNTNLFDQLSFGVGGGPITLDSSCDAISSDEEPFDPVSMAVYARSGTEYINVGSTVRLDRFVIFTRPQNEQYTLINWLPSLCAVDQAVLANAKAIAPDGGEHPVFRHGQSQIYDAGLGPLIAETWGVTLPLEALMVPGRWQIVSDYNGQTYSLNIDLPESGPPFMVQDGDRYLVRRFAPGERIKVFALGADNHGPLLGQFEIQADQNGNAIFVPDVPDLEIGSANDLTLIGESGSSIVAAGTYSTRSQSLTKDEVVRLLHDYAWGSGGGASTGPGSAPTLRNFRFCDRDCGQSGANLVSGYSGYTEDIYVAWDYEGMQDGMTYSREWYSDNDLWIRYNCVWHGPASGTWTIHLFDHDGGLIGGNWTIRVTVEGTPFAATVRLTDSNTFWDPVGTASSCPDF